MTRKMLKIGRFLAIFMVLKKKLHDNEQPTAFHDIPVDIL